MTVRVHVNGKTRTVPGDSNMPLLDFLRAYDVNPKLVAVAINGEVIPRSAYDGALVRDGDAIEVVRMVGGGA